MGLALAYECRSGIWLGWVGSGVRIGMPKQQGRGRVHCTTKHRGVELHVASGPPCRAVQELQAAVGFPEYFAEEARYAVPAAPAAPAAPASTAGVAGTTVAAAAAAAAAEATEGVAAAAPAVAPSGPAALEADVVVEPGQSAGAGVPFLACCYGPRRLCEPTARLVLGPAAQHLVRAGSCKHQTHAQSLLPPHSVLWTR